MVVKIKCNGMECRWRVDIDCKKCEYYDGACGTKMCPCKFMGKRGPTRDCPKRMKEELKVYETTTPA